MTNEAPEKELPERIIHACPDYIIAKREGDSSHIIRTQQISIMRYSPKKDAEGIISIYLRTDYEYTFRIDCTESQFNCFIKKFIPGFNSDGGMVIY